VACRIGIPTEKNFRSAGLGRVGAEGPGSRRDYPPRYRGPICVWVGYRLGLGPAHEGPSRYSPAPETKPFRRFSSFCHKDPSLLTPTWVAENRGLKFCI